MAIGSVYGAVAAYLLYALVKVKPKFYFTQKNNAIKNYLQNGYTQFDESAPYKWLNIFWVTWAEFFPDNNLKIILFSN